MVTRGWLKEQIEKYLLTINETHVEEWCVSNRDLADYVLGGFESFLFPDEAKEERRRHREELGYEP